MGMGWYVELESRPLCFDVLYVVQWTLVHHLTFGLIRKTAADVISFGSCYTLVV
jgi:hypothetical protein